MSAIGDALRAAWRRAGRTLGARRLAGARSELAWPGHDEGAAVAAPPAPEDEHRAILDRERQLRVLMSSLM